MVEDFVKVVRCSTPEELAELLNHYLGKGWFLEEKHSHYSDFFQEHSAVLVSKRYVSRVKKYNSLIESNTKALILKKE